MNNYDILGISSSATKEEITKAFRKLAHVHHPDKKGGDAKKFSELKRAYDEIMNRGVFRSESQQEESTSGFHKTYSSYNAAQTRKDYGAGEKRYTDEVSKLRIKMEKLYDERDILESRIFDFENNYRDVVERWENWKAQMERDRINQEMRQRARKGSAFARNNGMS